MSERQTIAETIRDLRISLWANAEFLRRLDSEEAERVARKLDRLRATLKPFAEKTS
jgi:hypothetical protein